MKKFLFDNYSWLRQSLEKWYFSKGIFVDTAFCDDKYIFVNTGDLLCIVIYFFVSLVCLNIEVANLAVFFLNLLCLMRILARNYIKREKFSLVLDEMLGPKKNRENISESNIRLAHNYQKMRSSIFSFEISAAVSAGIVLGILWYTIFIEKQPWINGFGLMSVCFSAYMLLIVCVDDFLVTLAQILDARPPSLQ